MNDILQNTSNETFREQTTFNLPKLEELVEKFPHSSLSWRLQWIAEKRPTVALSDLILFNNFQKSVFTLETSEKTKPTLSSSLPTILQII